jgi:hypothetical protein
MAVARLAEREEETEGQAAEEAPEGASEETDAEGPI